MKINVGSSQILPYERNLISKVLDSNQISPGPYCRKFEKEFARIHHLKHAAFVSSGTDALRIALEALKERYGWKDGDEVLVPAITFVATLNVILQVGLKPILVDVGMHDYMMNANRYLISEKRYVGDKKKESHVNQKKPERAVCVIIAHLFGQPADMDPLLQMAREMNLKVVEDSCETMFVKYKGQMVGTFGDVSCFSTYACHLLSTGVGGIVCTNDDRLNSLIRSLSNHGRDVAYIPGYSKPKTLEDFIDRHFKYDRIGYSSRATELQAALGLGQLKVWKENLRKRQFNANYLTQRLEMWWMELALPYPVPDREHAYMMYPIVIKEMSKASKRELMIHLGKCGIESRDMMPITSQQCYKNLIPMGKTYPTAQGINERGFYIGCHPELTQKDLDKIVKSFRIYFDSLDKK